MLRIVRPKSVAATLTALAALLALGAAAEAQTKPFKISGEGVGPTGVPLPGEEPRSHWIVGEATHLGRHSGEGSIRMDTVEVIDIENGIISGLFGSATPYEFVAANGDKLVTIYGRDDDGLGGNPTGKYELTILEVIPRDDGEFDLVVEAFWIADFVVQPDQSTGRFAGVTGSWTMFAWSEPFVLGSSDPLDYGWEGVGELTFPKGRRK